MESTNVLQADYLDIIYDHRNKQYGGYELRKHYNRRVGKAALILFSVLGALISFSFVSSKKVVIEEHKHDPYIMTVIDIKPPVDVPKPPQPPPPPAPPPAAPASTVVLLVPKIVVDADVKPGEEPKEVKELANAQLGSTNNAGSTTGIGSGPAEGTGREVVPVIPPPEPPRKWVQQMPEFNGNITEYISAHLRYPEAARDASIEGRVVVKFVVNEDGSVSDIVVVQGIGGGCDEEALRMVHGMPKWKPGKQNGIPVKVYYSIPIKFVLN